MKFIYATYNQYCNSIDITTFDNMLLRIDRTGNRRFVPVMVNKEKALHHTLENEEEIRAYIEQS